MSKIKSFDELKKMRDQLHEELELREKSNAPDSMIQIKVSMATCGIASGAKEVMSYIITTLKEENINAIVTQSGCMGHCESEPIIEVTIPGQKPVIYGHVNQKRANEIINKHIKGGKIIDDIIRLKSVDTAKDI